VSLLLYFFGGFSSLRFSISKFAALKGLLIFSKFIENVCKRNVVGLAEVGIGNGWRKCTNEGGKGSKMAMNGKCEGRKRNGNAVAKTSNASKGDRRQFIQMRKDFTKIIKIILLIKIHLKVQ
jgi:hypothetical protein